MTDHGRPLRSEIRLFTLALLVLLLLLAPATVWAEEAVKLVPVGAEFQVNTITTSFQVNPDVAHHDNGFVVTWSSRVSAGTDTSLSSIPGDSDRGLGAQRYGTDGSPLGAVFAVPSATTDSQETGTIRRAPDGTFVVAWASYVAGPPTLRMRRLASDGMATGSEIQVTYNTGTALLGPNALDFASDGCFVVAWNDTASPGDDPA